MGRGVFGLLLLLTACSGSDDRPPVLDPYNPPLPRAKTLPGCEDQSYAVCDIEKPDCQEQTFALATCLREDDPGTAPAAVLMTEDELVELFKEEFEAAAPDADPSIDRALVLLGLLAEQDLDPERLAELTAAGIAGLYLPEDDQVIVVDRELPRTYKSYHELDRQMILLHEYIHALQDREQNLTKLLDDDTTSDTLLGRVSLVEGEATMYQLLATIVFRGYDLEDFDVDETLTWSILDTDSYVHSVASPLLTWRGSFPYSYGARYAYRNWKKHGADGVRALFDDLPNGLQVIFEGEKLGSTPDLPAFEPDTPPTPAGYELSFEDELGAWHQLGFWGQWLSLEACQSLVAGWRGDHVWLYSNPETQQVAAVWKLRFADSVETSGLSDLPFAAPPAGGYWGGTSGDGNVTLVVSGDADLLLNWDP